MPLFGTTNPFFDGVKPMSEDEAIDTLEAALNSMKAKRDARKAKEQEGSTCDPDCLGCKIKKDLGNLREGFSVPPMPEAKTPEEKTFRDMAEGLAKDVDGLKELAKNLGEDLDEAKEELAEAQVGQEKWRKVYALSLADVLSRVVGLQQRVRSLEAAKK